MLTARQRAPTSTQRPPQRAAAAHGPAAQPPQRSTKRASCACGGGCPRCVSGSLNISVPGDATERDADRLATSALSASSAPPPEQRRTSAAAGSHSLPGGRELPREVRSVFERGFGA